MERLGVFLFCIGSHSPRNPSEGLQRLAKRAPVMGFSMLELCMTKAVGNRPEWRTRKADRPRCGARTRAGTLCQAAAVWDKANDRPRNGRCRMHGGLSTGPKTLAGRARALANLCPRRREKREFAPP